MPRPRRSPAAAALLVLSTALAVSFTPALAAVDDADLVTRSNLPTVGQVADVYDGLDKGRRELTPWRETLVRSESCVGVTIGQEAASGKEATYLGKGGSSLYRRGMEDPMVLVQKFSEKADSKDVYSAMEAADTACEGDHESGTATSSLDLVELPELDAGAAHGYREHLTYENGAKTVDFRRVVVVVREGRHLVQVETRCRDCAPVKKKVVRTMRITLDRIP